MDRYPYAKPPRWWSPLPQRLLMKLWEPLRRRQQVHDHRILKIKVEGLEHVASSISAGHGVLVTPNHAGHGDCYLLLEALPQLKNDFYFMTAWQVFQLAGPASRLAYRHHGCFSIDRETSDLSAYREAVRVLAETSCPLVVFPEGDVYHLAEHVMPPRDGAFTIAMTAARRSGRSIACVPCALKYEYVEDPTPALLPVMAAIERRLGSQVDETLSLADRAERLIEATIRWRESQYLDQSGQGSLEDRLERVKDAVLSYGEQRLGLVPAEFAVPERVKQLRQTVISRRAELAGHDNNQHEATYDSILEDAFIAVQLYSYRPGYVAERPTIERIAETVDKLEEDVLGLPTANIRGKRHGTICFGAPTMVTNAGNRAAAGRLGQEMRQRMQELVYQPAREPIGT